MAVFCSCSLLVSQQLLCCSSWVLLLLSPSEH
jgi:hypothetical protein